MEEQRSQPGRPAREVVLDQRVQVTSGASSMNQDHDTTFNAETAEYAEGIF